MGVYVGDNLVAGNVGEVYSKAQVDAMIANAVALAEPTGSIKPFAGTTIPDGYLLCDGSAVSRTTYAALFAVIGTTYGTGDGSTTFNLPNYSGSLPICGVLAVTSLHDYKNPMPAELPNIIGSFGTGDQNSGVSSVISSVSGAFTKATATSVAYATKAATASNVFGVNFSAQNSKSAYSRNDNVVLPTRVSMRFFIKY